MKKISKLTVGIIFIILVSSIITSCDKKAPVEMHNISVDVTYAPNPAVTNTIISFSFSVMDDNVMADVENISCTFKKDSTDTGVNMSVVRAGKGTYTGQFTFTEKRTYLITFKCSHMDDPVNKEFNITVQ